MYKNLIIISALSWSINTKTFAQKTYFDLLINRVSTNIYYGDQNNDLKDFKKSSKGYQAGISFQAGITSGFSLVSELYFIRKGGKLIANNPNAIKESSLLINTIELPLLARVHFGKVYFNAGPAITYNLSGTNKIGTESSDIRFENTNGGFKRMEASLQMGGGIELPLKERRISLDMRYSYGLNNISYNKEIFNRSIMVSIHFSKALKNNPFGRKTNE